MPEGDSLRRIQTRLAPVLEGQVATRLWFRKLRGHQPREGQEIEAVRAVGKNLLIDFDRALTLRTHLGMPGWWRVIGAGIDPPPSPKLRVVVGTETGTALCFAAPTVDTFLRGGATPLDHLGPDLSEDDFDLAEAMSRARLIGNGKLLAEALLDQRIAAGAGNVFKSEVAFLARIHPFTPMSSLSDDDIERVWTIAHQQLVANRSLPSRRTTRSGRPGRTYVYDRRRLACRRCSDSILFSPAGEITSRSTYWCPRCQPTPIERYASEDPK